MHKRDLIVFYGAWRVMSPDGSQPPSYVSHCTSMSLRGTRQYLVLGFHNTAGLR